VHRLSDGGPRGGNLEDLGRLAIEALLRTLEADHGGAAVRFEAGKDVLHPAPVGLAAGEARTLGEAVEFVGVVVLFLELGLVPHGVGHGTVESPEAVALAEFGFAKGVPDLNLALHVVDDHVHIGHGPGAGFVFLAIELQGCGRERIFPPAVFFPALAVWKIRPPFFIESQLAFDEQAG